MMLLSTILAFSCATTALLDYAMPRWRADPHLRIEDAYKWIYQATRGGEHAVPDSDMARKWLNDEWRTLTEPNKNEPLWEPLCPGSEIGRLNLRPFRSQGGDKNDLLAAFLTSSRAYNTERSAFVDPWLELGRRLNKKRAGKLDHRAWTMLDTKMKARDYPAIHHSESYESAHRPAYRLLTSAEMERLK